MMDYAAYGRVLRKRGQASGSWTGTQPPGQRARGILRGRRSGRAAMANPDSGSEETSATQGGPAVRTAKFGIGQIVKHRHYPFRGVIFDVDPEFNNTEEWWLSIPEHIRPKKEQPFYHLFAENEETTYVAYVSEQNLLPDDSGKPVGHPQVAETFGEMRDGSYERRDIRAN
jgi:heat shock protein HspQ